MDIVLPSLRKETLETRVASGPVKFTLHKAKRPGASLITIDSLQPYGNLTSLK